MSRTVKLLQSEETRAKPLTSAVHGGCWRARATADSIHMPPPLLLLLLLLLLRWPLLLRWLPCMLGSCCLQPGQASACSPAP